MLLIMLYKDTYAWLHTYNVSSQLNAFTYVIHTIHAHVPHLEEYSTSDTNKFRKYV